MTWVYFYFVRIDLDRDDGTYIYALAWRWWGRMVDHLCELDMDMDGRDDVHRSRLSNNQQYITA